MLTMFIVTAAAILLLMIALELIESRSERDRRARTAWTGC